MVHHAAYGLSVESLDVIVIDDSRPMQTIFRSVLSAFGIGRLRVFDNAEDALEAMLAEPPTVIITDWKMRPISGYRLLRSIRHRNMAPLCYVPVIMVTAHGTRALVDKAFRAGAHQFMVKPVSPNMLQQRLAHLVRDDREFVLEGDSYIIEGMEDVLNTHAAKLTTLEHARKHHHDAVKKVGDMQHVVDRIVEGSLSEDDAPPDLSMPVPPRPAPVSVFRLRAGATSSTGSVMRSRRT
ncbi:MAG: response regulator [Hyphomicrobiales bacterium]